MPTFPVVRVNQTEWNVLLEHLLQLGVTNARLAQKEPTVQRQGWRLTLCALMALIRMLKTNWNVSSVMQGLDAQVLEWKHL